MGNKKNIDRLFQEQFKNFEVSPDDAIWENIQSQLEEDRRRKRIFPLWMKLGSIAASLLLLIAVSSTLFSTDDIKDEMVGVSEDESSTIENDLNADENGNKSDIIGNKVSVAPVVYLNSSDLQDDLLDQNESVFKNKQFGGSDINNVNLISSENVPVSNNRHSNKSGITTQGLSVDANNNTKSILKVDPFSKDLNVLKNVTVVLNSTVLKSENELTTLNNNDGIKVKEVNDIVNDVSYFEKENTQFNSSRITDKEFTKNNNEGFESIGNDNLNNIANNNVVDKENSFTNNTGHIADKVVEVEFVENEDDNNDSKNMVASSGSGLDKEKGNDEECIEEQEISEEKTIEEAVAELKIEEDKTKDEEDVVFSKWNITPNIAPVYYNTLSGGSPIDSELSANKKKGQLTMSYGLGVGYVVSKRLTIRTGLNKIELGYNTQDVAINSSPETTEGPRINNINLAPEAASLNISSSNDFLIAQIPSSFSSLFNSSLNQRLGYLEVPLELSYKVSDKKIKIDVIAGLSTFFLNKNEIYTETNGKTTFIGEANNLNKMSYSTNIGLGFNCKIAKSFNFNFEPMFKYQLNTFSNDSGNFKPYILGVYSGFSFKF